jgi:NADH-quinone oxidoreductase subunit L
MWVSTMAIAGIVPFSGFFSKDEILYQIARHSWGIWFVGVLTAAMTAFYMMRLVYKTFYGSAKTEDAVHTHEASPSMTVPLIILGILATVSGVFAMPSIFGVPNYFERFLQPAAAPTFLRTSAAVNEPSQLVLIVISAVVAFAGILVAYFGYRVKDGRDLFISAEQKPANKLYQWVLHKWFVDELYYQLFTVPGRVLSGVLYRIMDVKIIDGAVNGVGWLAGRTGAVLRNVQTGYVRNYAFTMLIGALIVMIAILIGFRSIF